jgi:hypothetical protein
MSMLRAPWGFIKNNWRMLVGSGGALLLSYGLFVELRAMFPSLIVRSGSSPLPIVAAAALAAGIGVLLAFFLSLVTRGPEGPSAVEGLGFRFQGPAALVLLWIIATVALSVTIQVFLPRSP